MCPPQAQVQPASFPGATSNRPARKTPGPHHIKWRAVCAGSTRFFPGSNFKLSRPENSRPSPHQMAGRVRRFNLPGGLPVRVTLCLNGLCVSRPFAPRLPALVGLSGLEPPTSRLSGVRSNRLSYKPLLLCSSLFPRPRLSAAPESPRNPPAAGVVEMNGIEPMTPCLQSRCSPS